MTVLPNNSFTRACQFLNAVSVADRTQIEEELVEMTQYRNELDPQDLYAHTLSEHRKCLLEKRISELFKVIEAKLHPNQLTPVQIHEKQISELRSLMAKLPTLSSREFRKEFKKINPETQNKIYKIVWIASNCPSDFFFNSTLDEDESILSRHFPSLIGAKEGPVLEQVEADIIFDHELTMQGACNFEDAIDNRVQFFRMQLGETANTRVKMKAIFNAMPSLVQDRLRSLGIYPPFYGREINPELYKTLGSHFELLTGRTTFRVYAPNASKVVLNLTAFGNVHRTIEMLNDGHGVWSAETDQASPGRSYHFMVTGKAGFESVKKVDPFAFQNFIHNPDTHRDIHESIVVDMDKDFNWTDSVWLASRAKCNWAKKPLLIYEIHSPSWMLNENGRVLNWRELAPQLAQYCIISGYNAVELMALFAHPHPISMGYQITNFFAPNVEMGSWEDFQFFVNYMHHKAIHIFVDWSPGHFAVDKYALGDFDGTSVFEDDDPQYAHHPEWGTKVFDFKKQFTKDFLSSNADFLFNKLHVDGLRVDAVASMLYLNYARPLHHKRVNKYGNNVDLDVKRFFRHLNAYVHNKYPGALMMAEESSGYPNITRSPADRGEKVKTRGLGFDMTWHMGFMYDSLEYWKKNASERNSFFSLFTNTLKNIDGGSDIRPRGKSIIAYSHDENANGKGTVLVKMSGNNRAEKFANGRLALAYQLLRGGGPVLDFMGNEFLQSEEWHGRLKRNIENPKQKPIPSVQWEELDLQMNALEYHLHRGAQASRRDLNQLCLNSPGLWDQSDEGFSWLHVDSNNCVLSFHRRSSDCNHQFACLFNTSDKDMTDYLVPLPDASYAPELDRLKNVKEVYNTDHVNYAGKGRVNGFIEISRDSHSNRPTHFKLRLPPYTAIVLEEQF